MRNLLRSAVTGATLVSAMATMGVASADDGSSTGDVSILTAGCPSSGYPNPGNPSESCTSMSNGALFHRKFHPNASVTRVESKYVKVSGSAITAKLGYNYSGTNYWGSTFTQSSGTTKTKTWDRSYNFWCNTTVGLLNVTGQGSFQTPISRCQ
ncbi:hypothetical protein ABT063_17500 [Streptomyces sp. NPDC002838]|uniref:hypothetical protein n=1 Tax=Streptomyces sp. NPDC002838 TaxID=3154436 RepID=UPI00332F7389